MTLSIPVTLQSEALCPEGGTGTPLTLPWGAPEVFFGPSSSGLCFLDPGCRNLNATRGCSDSKDGTGPQRLEPVGRGDCDPVVVSPDDWSLEMVPPSSAPPPPLGVFQLLSLGQLCCPPTRPGPRDPPCPGKLPLGSTPEVRVGDYGGDCFP